MKNSRFLSGIIVIAVGSGVILTLFLPSSWLIMILSITLIWAGWKMICR